MTTRSPPTSRHISRPAGDVPTPPPTTRNMSRPSGPTSGIHGLTPWHTTVVHRTDRHRRPYERFVTVGVGPGVLPVHPPTPRPPYCSRPTPLNPPPGPTQCGGPSLLRDGQDGGPPEDPTVFPTSKRTGVNPQCEGDRHGVKGVDSTTVSGAEGRQSQVTGEQGNRGAGEFWGHSVPNGMENVHPLVPSLPSLPVSVVTRTGIRDTRVSGQD